MDVKWPWKRGKDRHREVEQTLSEHEDRLDDMAKRVRILEQEYGIVARPRLKKVSNTE